MAWRCCGRITCELAEPPLACAAASAPCSAARSFALNSGADLLTPTNCASDKCDDGGNAFSLNFKLSSDDLSCQVIGPVPAGDDAERVLVRVPRSDGHALAAAFKTGAAARSARKAADPVKLVLDPLAPI